MARRYANRLLIARILHGWRRFGITAIPQVWYADQNGRRAGRLQHHPVSARTVDFYNNPDLRPEFGNVPLWHKALGKLQR